MNYKTLYRDHGALCMKSWNTWEQACAYADKLRAAGRDACAYPRIKTYHAARRPRVQVFNNILNELEYFPRTETAFLSCYELCMITKTGQCSEQDLLYAQQRLDGIIEHTRQRCECEQRNDEPSHDDEWGDR